MNLSRGKRVLLVQLPIKKPRAHQYVRVGSVRSDRLLTLWERLDLALDSFDPQNHHRKDFDELDEAVGPRVGIWSIEIYHPILSRTETRGRLLSPVAR